MMLHHDSGAWTAVSRFRPGDRVTIGGGAIGGTVAQVIFRRGMRWPLYTVAWWQDGSVCAGVFDEPDVEAAG
jgi:hypothetical protein